MHNGGMPEGEGMLQKILEIGMNWISFQCREKVEKRKRVLEIFRSTNILSTFFSVFCSNTFSYFYWNKFAIARFLLEWLSFTYRYVPHGILKFPPQVQDLTFSKFVRKESRYALLWCRPSKFWNPLKVLDVLKIGHSKYDR